MTPVDPVIMKEATVGYIRFQDGFKYQLTEDATIQTKIKPKSYIVTTFVTLSPEGKLCCKAGFAWNGVSGPTIQRDSNRRGGCFHDALYRLIRFGLLPLECRTEADDLLYAIWIADGMWEWLAKIEIKLLKQFGVASARPSAEPIVYTSP